MLGKSHALWTVSRGFIWRSNHSRGLKTISKVVHESPQRIAVLHGSHSGNTHRFAKYLWSELKWRLNIDSQLRNISSIDFRDLQSLDVSDTLLILVSTFGSGEPNAATLPLWHELMTSQRLQCSFSVMSRGSSLYDTTFARAGIRIDEEFMQRGAHRLAPLGIQDKMSLRGNDEYFNWKEGVIMALKERYHLEERPFLYVPSSRPVMEVEPTNERGSQTPAPIFPEKARDAQLTDIKVRHLQSSDRQYLYAELKLRPASDGYKAGDHIVIWPENSTSEVEKFLRAIFGNSSRRHNLVEYKGKTTSYELLAKYYLDINGQPEQELLLKLAYMAPSSRAKREIREFIRLGASIPSLATVLESTSRDAPWLKNLPVPSAFFDLLPHLEPRRFSISSSPSDSPEYAGISVVVEHDRISGFWGTATGGLLRICDQEHELPGTRVMALHEPLPGFNLPSDISKPLLLFGVGTGVAPYRGFVRERFLQQQQDVEQKKSGEIVMFSGTRTADDLAHAKEFQFFHNCPDFDFRLISAFSRVPHSLNAKYIGEAIMRNGDLIYDLIKRGAHIYICGDMRKVRRSVRNGVSDIIAKKEAMSTTEANAQWKAMTRCGRIHLELW